MTSKSKIGLFAVALMVLALNANAAGQCSPSPTSPALRSQDGYLLDSLGRVTLLRGANVPAHSYPAGHFNEQDLQALESFGFNFIRLGISWEKAEPEQGKFDMNYIRSLRDFAQKAGAHGIYVMPEVHKFGWCQVGGDMPAWACGGKLNSGSNFLAMLTTSRRFWKDLDAQQDLIELWLVIVKEFKGLPNLMGYNVLNEPIDDGMLVPGVFDKELFRFYGNWIKAVRQVDPLRPAVLEPSTINLFIPLKPPPFPFDNLVYAPHPYFAHTYNAKGLVIIEHEDKKGLEKKYARNAREAKMLNAPLVIGEYGGDPDRGFTREWLAQSLMLQDRYFAGAAIWAYGRSDTGWSILDGKGEPKPFHWEQLRRPYPRHTAGKPLTLHYSPAEKIFSYSYAPDQAISAATEIFLPRELAKGPLTVSGAAWVYNEDDQLLCLTPLAGSKQVKVEAGK